MVQPVFSPNVRKLCTQPYPNHPKGCPNWGKRLTCPPAAPVLTEAFDCSKPFYVIWNRFPFGEHVARMKAKHPEWSDRQCRCCLYWQGTARKQLRQQVRLFQQRHLGLQVTYCPEAIGVDVTATMKKIGIELEWPPQQWAYQVALAGTKGEHDG